MLLSFRKKLFSLRFQVLKMQDFELQKHTALPLLETYNQPQSCSFSRPKNALFLSVFNNGNTGLGLYF